MARRGLLLQVYHHYSLAGQLFGRDHQWYLCNISVGGGGLNCFGDSAVNTRGTPGWTWRLLTAVRTELPAYCMPLTLCTSIVRGVLLRNGSFLSSWHFSHFLSHLLDECYCACAATLIMHDTYVN